MLEHKALNYSFSQIIKILEFDWLTSTYLFGWKEKKRSTENQSSQNASSPFLAKLSLGICLLSISASFLGAVRAVSPPNRVPLLQNVVEKRGPPAALIHINCHRALYAKNQKNKRTVGFENVKHSANIGSN